jgi:hypothetical protein
MNRLLAAFQHVQWRRRTNALALDRPVIAFDPAIALRIEWACADVRHPGDLHQVRDDPRTRPREPLTCLLRKRPTNPFSSGSVACNPVFSGFQILPDEVVHEQVGAAVA